MNISLLPNTAPAQKTPSEQAEQMQHFGAMMQMITGYWTTASIYAAARLGIADLLQLGSLSVKDLSIRTETNEDYLYRLLRALSGMGIFQELPEKRFEQTPMSRLLAADCPNSIRGMAMMMGEEHYQVWGNLLKALKTGDRAFETTFGLPIFDYLQKHPESGEIFNAAMTGFASTMHRAVVNVYDFSPFHTLVDVGGGHGALLSSILQEYPKLEGVLFDLPHVTAGATIPVVIKDRFTAVGGDFFQAVHPGADAYILSTVIHDWSDELSLKILKNIHAAMPEKGTLLLVENVVESDNQPSFAKFLDINMLLMTEGGRERSSEEYRALYEVAGFELTRIIPVHNQFAVIEGRKR